MNITKSWVALAAFTCSVLAPYPRAWANESEFDCVLTVSSTEILPLEPVYAMAQLRYRGTAAVKRTATWGTALYVTQEDGSWTHYIHYRKPRRRPQRPSEKVFEPGTVLSYPVWFDVDRGGRHVFPKPGVYQVRASISQVESAPVQITVRQPDGANAAAYDKLRSTGLAKDLSEGTVRAAAFNAKTIASLEKFVSEFPASYYADLARLRLAQMWIRGGGHTVALDKAKGLLVGLAGKAQPIAYRANYDLARIAQLEGKDAEATKLYKKILAASPDPYYHYLTEQAILAKAQKPIEPPWRDPAFRVTKELKALGYDLNLTPELEQRLKRELTAMNREAKQAFQDKKITGRELREREMENYRQWVLKNLKPKTQPAPP